LHTPHAFFSLMYFHSLVPLHLLMYSLLLLFLFAYSLLFSLVFLLLESISIYSLMF
jgi:hypothetical protein